MRLVGRMDVSTPTHIKRTQQAPAQGAVEQLILKCAGHTTVNNKTDLVQIK